MRTKRVLFIVVLALATIASVVPAAMSSAAPGAPTITGSPESAVGSPAAAFTFFAEDADTYECRVFESGLAEGDRPEFGACTGGASGHHQVSGLADGAQTFQVRAVDDGGPGEVATHEWEVGSQGVVQWVDRPTGTIAADRVAATFTADGATSFQCRLITPMAADPTWSGCGIGQQGTWVSPQLPNGAYTLQVRAGATGTVAATDFTVASLLTVAWVDRPTGTIAADRVAATFSALGATSFQCRLITPIAADPSWSGCGIGQQGSWVSAQLPNGAYNAAGACVGSDRPAVRRW